MRCGPPEISRQMPAALIAQSLNTSNGAHLRPFVPEEARQCLCLSWSIAAFWPKRPQTPYQCLRELEANGRLLNTSKILSPRYRPGSNCSSASMANENWVPAFAGTTRIFEFPCHHWPRQQRRQKFPGVSSLLPVDPGARFPAVPAPCASRRRPRRTSANPDAGSRHQ